MVSLNETIQGIIVAIEAADPALSREDLIDLGVKEKAGSNRKTLLRWLREKAKELPVAENDDKVLVDAPGEPPPGYEPPTEEPPVVPPGTVAVAEIFTAPADLAPAPLMQEVDPRPCSFPFQSMDVNLNPVCAVHNSGMCFPCQNEDPPVLRCRVVCFAESPKHRAIKQPKIVLKERTIVDNPASVERISPSEFDE